MNNNHQVVNYEYWLWEEALTADFCKSMVEQIDWTATKDAEINMGAEAVVDSKLRRTDVAWQSPMQPLGCIARTYIEAANYSAGWGYHLSGQEETQLTRYRSSRKGHYDWHIDTFPPKDGVQRKLSCVILLNDASEFEGGVLQLKGMEDRNILTKPGSIVVFPSFIEHRVTPVTKGVRYTAVTWANGPSFR